jgi:hypothetical protein
MDYFTQPGGRSRDEITPSLAEPSSGPRTPSRRGSAQVRYNRPQTPLQPSSIRIRRLPSTPLIPQINVEDTNTGNAVVDAQQVGRQRSSSEPQQMNLSSLPPNDLTKQRTAASYMPSVKEETSASVLKSPQTPTQIAATPGRRRRASTSARSALGLERVGSRLRPTPSHPVREYESGVVDLLDVVGACDIFSH